MAPNEPAPDRDMGRCFQALSEPKRLRILDLLRSGEKCVGHLTEELQVAQSLLSFHLKALRDAGLVADRREGRWVYYSLVPGRLDELKVFLDDLLRSSADTASPAGGPSPVGPHLVK